MICNYENITDYCSNRYSYQFIGTISNNGVVSIDKSETAPVLRTDKITGQNKIITQFSTDLIQPCSSTEDNEGTTEWDCYIIYRYISNGYISDPSLDTLKNDQIDIINNAYQSSIEEGVLVQINNVDVILGSSIEDQIYYQSILNYAQVLYDDDSDAVMPSFTDAQNNVYKVSYDILITIFKTYFTKVIYYKNLKESLVFQVSDSNTISDLESLDWCNTKVLINNLQPTKIQTTINKLVVQSCEDNTNNGGSLCDPPCDPNSCLVCVDGSCESSCGENQYCCDGVCQDEPCCESDEDCAAGELCCNSSCQEAVEQCLTGCIEITVNEYMSDSCPDGMSPINDPAPAPPVSTQCSGAGNDCINNPTSPFIGNYGVLVTHSCFDEQLPCDECPVTCCSVCPSDNT